jgi:DNA-binding NtrC family response regulator
MRVLVVDDEEIMRVTLCDALTDAGHDAEACARAEDACKRLAETPFDVTLADLRMPGMDGLAYLEYVRREHPGVVTLIMTAFGSVETAVKAMKTGAYDYLTKPFDPYELMRLLDRLREHRSLTEENQRLRTVLRERHGFHQLIGKSAAMQQVYETLDVVCEADCTVLIEGETGTGKELVTNAIHFSSARQAKPLIKVSCAALSSEILESELFGHVRGAFTGATSDKVGRFERAHGGTLFLDEVDDIPLPLQVKLLRVLEDGSFERVGDTRTQSVDVRILAATKVDLRQLIQEKKFRDDLFYRLNEVPIRLPPLRERREDIPVLIEGFLRDRDSQPEIDDEAYRALLDYDWPGNVRELRHVIERVMMFHPDRIGRVDLPEEVLAGPSGEADLPREGSFDDRMSAVEARLLRDAMDLAGGNQREAARQLQMPSSTLRSRLERHGLL